MRISKLAVLTATLDSLRNHRTIIQHEIVGATTIVTWTIPTVPAFTLDATQIVRNIEEWGNASFSFQNACDSALNKRPRNGSLRGWPPGMDCVEML